MTMVRFRHLVAASPALLIGFAQAVSSSSASSSSSSSPPPSSPSPSSLAIQARSVLSDDMARLHHSVKRARNIVGMRDVAVSVSASKLQEVLADIRRLEKQVSALLPDGSAAAVNSKIVSQPGDDKQRNAAADQVGRNGPEHGKADYLLNAGHAGPKSASPTWGALLGASMAGALPGAVFNEPGGSPRSASLDLPPTAASTNPAGRGRSSTTCPSTEKASGLGQPVAEVVAAEKSIKTSAPEGSAKDSADGASSLRGAADEAFAPKQGPPSPDGTGDEPHGTPSDGADQDSEPMPPPSDPEDDDGLGSASRDTTPEGTRPKSSTASPIEAPLASQRPTVTSSAALKQGPISKHLTTTTITRIGSRRTTINITTTRTRTIWVGAHTKKSSADGSRASATPEATAKPSSRASVETGAATPSSRRDKAYEDLEKDTERVPTRKPDFSRAQPVMYGQRFVEKPQRNSNSSMKLYSPLKAERLLFASNALASAETAGAATVSKKLALPHGGGSARASPPPASGFVTVVTRASERPTEAKE